MKISLVIPAYNEEKYIGMCLESIQAYGQGLFEVIVINNASTDKTVEIAQSFSFVRVVDEVRKGLQYARGRGLTEAQGDLVAFIDADTCIPKNWTEKIKNKFTNNPRIVSLSGPYIYHDVSFLSKVCIWMYFVVLVMPVYFIIGYAAIGGNLVVRKEAVQSIGGFDETIAFYGDDTDIARRLSKIGKVMFSLDFYMYSSARRLKGEGVFATGLRYAINFFSIVFRGTPYNHEHSDIR